MFELVIAFVAGLIVMDFVWAHKLGLTRLLWVRIKERFSRRSQA
jgi:hypothetical protein